jgi:hypothetical protein
MSKSQIRSSFMLTAAALTLAPILAFAADPPNKGTLPGEQPATVQPEPTAEVPSTPHATAMDPHGSMGMNQPINSADVQKVFGMDVALVDLKALGPEQIKHLQQTLLDRGHYRGPVDGVVGPKTRSALTAMLAEQFAMNQRLINQGQITEQLASTIGLDVRGRTPVAGVDSPPDVPATNSRAAKPSTQPAQPAPNQ